MVAVFQVATLTVAGLAVAVPAWAQPRTVAAAGEVGGRAWPTPLDRPVSLHLRDVALRTALDRLAAAARVRLSYSAETLPLDRSVSVACDATPLGAALEAVLRGAEVQPVVVGVEQVVLAPARVPAAAAASDEVPNASPSAPMAVARMAVLDQVVVTGSAAGASQRALPFALDVVRASTGAPGIGMSTLAHGIDGTVPGIWVWTQSPSSLLARYGSIRGASSFGLTAPKIYIDGIEAANPLLVTALSPESVERVEVIRGPQGAAFYGADAISGVINVVTRHDGAADGGRQLEVRSGVGAAGSAFAEHPALVQDHGAALREGSGARSRGVSLSGSSIGAYVPGAGARHLFGNAYARRVGSAWALSATAYADGASANTAPSPLVAAALPTRPGGGTTGGGTAGRQVPATDAPRQSVWQYTLGGTATHAAGERWTHVVQAGVNGYRLTGLAVDPVAVPSSVDSALLAARGGADRGTLRASSVARWGEERGLGGSVTLAGDWAVLRDGTAATASPDVPRGPGAAGQVPNDVTMGHSTWLQTAGLSAQATAGWREVAYVTAGLRGERNGGYAEASRYAALPMFGATVVGQRGDVTVKLRTAYGRGLRPARTTTRFTTWHGGGFGARVPDLAPEEQRGVEGGVDLYVGRAFGVHATAFDQRASGLIQQVSIIAPGADTLPPRGGPAGARRITYALQNVGVITNRGVELEATWRAGPLGLAGTFTRVDSRVRQLALGYTGDLRPGDRMLEVPARTLGVDASWSAPRWAATLGASRAFDWTNYDRLRLAQAYTSNAHEARELVGAPLRAYWRTYDGVTHLRASVARDVVAGFGIVLAGDNLLDRQRGEPDDATVLPGRTLSLGVRARF
ncbi:TonB-dependent receptor plug [Gemmatirosa kalamazoonensis]|uniref:TonB-dependent receptor plug n=1 Tax=Gemmatirosa kalamazoonensis TaxID=861299 RepID=W0REX3_9BACT|nr:TonB-dependent receptor plug domain-containing protein [Gemmatirosa kalamazoonensis]AHG89336.1 TonB-dependent receptor plug [Gemmatirosa kalamazoonensis]